MRRTAVPRGRARRRRRPLGSARLRRPAGAAWPAAAGVGGRRATSSGVVPLTSSSRCRPALEEAVAQTCSVAGARPRSRSSPSRRTVPGCGVLAALASARGRGERRRARTWSSSTTPCTRCRRRRSSATSSATCSRHRGGAASAPAHAVTDTLKWVDEDEVVRRDRRPRGLPHGLQPAGLPAGRPWPTRWPGPRRRRCCAHRRECPPAPGAGPRRRPSRWCRRGGEALARGDRCRTTSSSPRRSLHAEQAPAGSGADVGQGSGTVGAASSCSAEEQVVRVGDLEVLRGCRRRSARRGRLNASTLAAVSVPR